MFVISPLNTYVVCRNPKSFLNLSCYTSIVSTFKKLTKEAGLVRPPEKSVWSSLSFSKSE